MSVRAMPGPLKRRYRLAGARAVDEPLQSLPYPVEALPSMLRNAVIEAQGFVQAPMALVVSSALAAMSLAA